MSDSRLKDRVFGSVYGLPAWAWVVGLCVFLVGVAFFPVSTSVTKPAPEDANRIGTFTDGATNESATLRYTARINDKPGFSVVSPVNSGPDLQWRDGSSKEFRTGVVSYDSDRGVFYRSSVYRFGDGEFKEVSKWVSSGTEFTRIRWSGDRPSVVEDWRSWAKSDASKTLVDSERSDNTTIVVIREEKEENIAQKKWENWGQGWTAVYYRVPHVSESGDLLSYDGVVGGSVDVSDSAGVSYSAEFDYKYNDMDNLLGATDVYGENRIPLALKLVMSVERVSGEFVRKEGASGVPASRPDWVTAAMNESR